MKVIAILLVLSIVAFELYDLGTFCYRTDIGVWWDKGGANLKVRVWHNAEIVLSKDVYDIPADRLTESKNKERQWVDSMVSVIKKSK